ncbi:MAG: CoA-binding protein [Candidatus Lokiarchaeota archaeon]|nr:CoA-binding protein [Candidatus Lokiarchaeota archaeon]
MLSSQRIDFEKLFFPRAIGIIGVSPDMRGGSFFVRSMKDSFKGPIYLFNPKISGEELYGYKIYSSILEINDPIDYVILAIPARLCPKVMEEIGKKGVPFVTVFASGFREVGNESLEQELLSVAKQYGVRIIGPNCLGIYNPKSGLQFGIGQARKSGNFSGVFQSGGIAQNMAQLAVSYGLYVSKFISIGNALDLSPVEFLDYFNNDDYTKIIGLYIENLRSINQGRQFMSIVKECNLNRKPVILWRAGFGEATKKAILSHTGGLAGNNEIWKAVGKQTGSCIVSNSNELAALASAFNLTRLPNSRNVGVIGIGGGSTIEAIDIFEKNNLTIPSLTEKTINKMKRFIPDVNTNVTNPLDLGGSGIQPNIYYRSIMALDKDPNISSIVFIKDPERFGNFQKLMKEVLRNNPGLPNIKGMDLNREFIKFISKAKSVSNKPMYCVMLKINEGFEEYKSRYKFKLKLLNRNVPVFESLDLAGSILDKLNSYREFLEKHGKYPKM